MLKLFNMTTMLLLPSEERVEIDDMENSDHFEVFYGLFL